jgi:replication fork protection complex subunit Tof1/Swi1
VHLLATDNEDDEDKLPKKLRMPAELEIKKSKGYSWSQQVGIAVALLSNENRDDLLTWIKDVSWHTVNLR